jgi:hypothetical protein
VKIGVWTEKKFFLWSKASRTKLGNCKLHRVKNKNLIQKDALGQMKRPRVESKVQRLTAQNDKDTAHKLQKGETKKRMCSNCVSAVVASDAFQQKGNKSL